MSEHDDRLVRRVMHAASSAGAPGPCPDAEVLALFAGRALDGEERRATEAHVAACARCQATLVAFVRSEAPEATGVGAAGVGAVVSWWSGWRWVVPVAATAAIVTVAVWVRQPDGSATFTAPAAPERQAGAGAADMAAQQERAAPAAGAAAGGRAPLEGGAGPAEERRADARAGSGAAGAPRPSDTPTFRVSEPMAKAEAPRDQAESAGELQQALADAAPGLTAPPAAPPIPVGEAAAAPPPPPPAPAAVAPPAVMDEPQARDRGESQRAEARRADAAAGPPPPAAALSPPSLAEAVTTTPEAAREADAAGQRAASETRTTGAAGAMGTGRGPGVAPGSGGPTARASLTGRVVYRARIALPAGAVIEVRLLDVTRADAPATLVARAEITTRGEQVPVPFTLSYDAGAVDPARRYAVEASIAIGGRAAWRSPSPVAVLTGRAPSANVEIVVQQLR